MVSTIAWTMFPVPLIAATILSLTVSIIPECAVFMFSFLRFAIVICLQLGLAGVFLCPRQPAAIRRFSYWMQL
jgi:hypothetical protein